MEQQIRSHSFRLNNIESHSLPFSSDHYHLMFQIFHTFNGIFESNCRFAPQEEENILSYVS